MTAGVYLVVRSHVLFALSGGAHGLSGVRLVSALYAALASIGQFDLKRALAYSTMSQIGFMFFAAGMRFYTGAMLLLVCHAFYKALLFLTAGNVLHGLHDETDLRRMGGLRADMPLSAAWFTVGALSLAGIPPLAGFFAKDQIVGFAATSSREVAWVLASLGAFLSALYIARPLFLTFFGRRRGREQAHEAPGPMQAPLAVLAFLTVVGGLFLGLTAEGGPGPLPRTGRGRGEHGEAALPERPDLDSIVLALAAVRGLLVWASAASTGASPTQPELAGGWRTLHVNTLYAWSCSIRQGVRSGLPWWTTCDRGAVNEVAEDVVEARGCQRIQRGFVPLVRLAFCSAVRPVVPGTGPDDALADRRSFSCRSSGSRPRVVARGERPPRRAVAWWSRWPRSGRARRGSAFDPSVAATSGRARGWLRGGRVYRGCRRVQHMDDRAHRVHDPVAIVSSWAVTHRVRWFWRSRCCREPRSWFVPRAGTPAVLVFFEALLVPMFW